MDIVEIKDLILSRYHNIGYVDNLPFLDGFELVKRAYEERDREFWYRQYLVLFPYMDESNLKTFDSWYEELREKAERNNYYATIPREDILKKVEEIRAKAGEVDGV